MADEIVTGTVRLPLNSRYIATNVYSKRITRIDPATGQSFSQTATFFGTWNPPKILERTPATLHIVSPDEFARPELIAHRVYGDKSLYWAIMQRSGVHDVFNGLRPGTRLFCPHIDDIQAALSATRGAIIDERDL